MKKRMRRDDPQRRQQWQAAVWQWQQSGQSVRAFCRTQGLKESAFYFWRRALAPQGPTGGTCEGDQQPKSKGRVAPMARVSPRRGGRRAAKDQARFLPVRVVAGVEQAAAGGIEIALSGGRSVRVQPGFDRQALADVVRVLEAEPC